MKQTLLELQGRRGEPIGKLREGVEGLLLEAERYALSANITKKAAMREVLAARIADAGFAVTGTDLFAAVNELSKVSTGQPARAIRMTVSPSSASSDEAGELNVGRVREGKKVESMKIPRSGSGAIAFFEDEREYPDSNAQKRFDQLAGIDRHKERLLVELEMLLFPEAVWNWSREHHGGKVLTLCERQQHRVPLVVLEGDVGTGKTALAESVGDALARRIGNRTTVHLLKINTQVRGAGHVGEMSDLIVQAFQQAEERCRSLKGSPLLLLLDEADALAASRDAQQMHHEDKAGLNTLLQRLDGLRTKGLALAVIFITNRPDALDPAIRRRAALTLLFERPDNSARERIFWESVPELNLTKKQVAELVELTGPLVPGRSIPFTASDITDRLLAGALRTAFSERRALRFEDLAEQARSIEPTPPFGSDASGNQR